MWSTISSLRSSEESNSFPSTPMSTSATTASPPPPSKWSLTTVLRNQAVRGRPSWREDGRIEVADQHDLYSPDLGLDAHGLYASFLTAAPRPVGAAQGPCQISQRSAPGPPESTRSSYRGTGRDGSAGRKRLSAGQSVLPMNGGGHMGRAARKHGQALRELAARSCGRRNSFTGTES